MYNAYTLILVLFMLAGLGTTVWGWRVIRKARAQRNWPSVQGEIITADPSSEDDDLLPCIEYRYTIEQHIYQSPMQLPSGTTPSPELNRQLIEKYPVGKTVMVYYHPQDPQQTILEPGPQGGDWLIVGFGLGSLLLGLFMLVFGW